MSIPLLDFQKIRSQDHNTLMDLRRGVCKTGFLVIETTPIHREDVDHVIDTLRNFFIQSEAYKSRYDMAMTNSNRGWGRPMGEQVNPDANPDFKEVFDIGTKLAADHPLRNNTYYAPNQWPDLPGFQETMSNYYQSAFDVSLELLSAIAMAAELPTNFFDDKFDPPMALLRGNYYPPRPDHAGAKDFGIAAHTDYGCLTLLAGDGVPGLEVELENGEWKHVTAKPGQFVINFGEMLANWSSGRIRATPHRVIGGHNERISIPFFFNPAYGTNVAPLGASDELLAGDYLSRRYDETYVHRQKTSEE